MNIYLTLVIIFTVGTAAIYFLKKFHIKSVQEWDGKTKEIPFEFNVDEAWVTNAVLTGALAVILFGFKTCNDYDIRDTQEYMHKVESYESIKKRMEQDMYEKAANDLKEKLIDNIKSDSK